MASASDDEHGGDRRARLVVMASGSGTNLQAILDACGQSPGASGPPALAAEVVLVIANRPGAYALTRAQQAGVAVSVLPHDGRRRADYDAELAYEARLVGADLVVLAGWDRLLTQAFLAHHRVVNLHPAKPGAFPGLGAVERAYRAWEQGRITSGGVMVHFVPDEGVDSGPVIASEEISFIDGETLEGYEDRVHEVEHRLLIHAIGLALAEQPSAR